MCVLISFPSLGIYDTSMVVAPGLNHTFGSSQLGVYTTEFLTNFGRTLFGSLCKWNNWNQVHETNIPNEKYFHDEWQFNGGPLFPCKDRVD